MFPIKNAVPTRYPPVVTWALIAANCLVFFVQRGLSPREEELPIGDIKTPVEEFAL
jgi:hypothetical protein